MESEGAPSTALSTTSAVTSEMAPPPKLQQRISIKMEPQAEEEGMEISGNGEEQQQIGLEAADGAEDGNKQQQANGKGQKQKKKKQSMPHPPPAKRRRRSRSRTVELDESRLDPAVAAVLHEIEHELESPANGL